MKAERILLAASWCIPLLCAVLGSSGSEKVVTEADGSQLIFKPLPASDEHYNSCYEVVRANTAVQFCYPAINIAGYSKCGTSAYYALFENNPDVLPANNRKEYCQRADQPLFDYLKGFPHPKHAATKKFIVNGCIRADSRYTSLQTLLEPNTANLVIVRSLPDRLWAGYNFWCLPEYDKLCDIPEDRSKWAREGMFRSPEFFDQLLRASTYPLFNGPLSMTNMSTMYSRWYHGMSTRLGVKPLMVANEALSSQDRLPALLRRVEMYIEDRLNTTPKLRISDVHHVNTGNNRGSKAVDTDVDDHFEDGRYKISGNRPLLDATREFIMQHWVDCEEISQLADYPYKCVPPVVEEPRSLQGGRRARR